MFESIRPDAPSVRFRSAAAVPLAAFLFAQFFYMLVPLFERVPVALFRSVDVILFAGAAVGAVAIVRVVRSAEIRGLAIAWLIAVFSLSRGMHNVRRARLLGVADEN